MLSSIKPKTLREWIKIYEDKTGDTFDWDFPKKGYHLLYMAERGFAMMKLDIEGKLVVVHQVCGDARFWRDLGEMMGVQNGCIAIGTICTRHIKPYIRSFGWEILKEFTHVGVGFEKRFLCQDAMGRKVVITHHCYTDKGEPQYWVVSYFNEKPSLDDDSLGELDSYPIPNQKGEENTDV